MQKALIIGQFGLGDTISNTLPLVQVLKKEGHLVHGFFHNANSYHLMRETPHFDACIAIACQNYRGSTFELALISLKEMFKDIVKIFPEYNKIYVQGGNIYSFVQEEIDKKLTKNVIWHLKHKSNYRPVEHLEKYGLQFKDDYLFLDINWYNEFYKDFKCKTNSVLFNGQSSQFVRTYSKQNEIVSLLQEKGFDVHQFDVEKDIRINIHLLNQVKYVLTTDTSSFWIAKALKKEPYVFMSKGRNLINPPNLQELKLGTNNVLKNWRYEMSDITPEEIVESFIYSIKKRSILLI